MSDLTVKRAGSEEGTRPGRTYQPNVDIAESPEAVWISVDMPGVDEKSVQVGLEDGVLTIEGRVSLVEYADLEPVYTEYNVGNFERRFRISDRVDAEKIEARLDNGALALTLPKVAAARPRTIEISGS